MSKNQFLFPSFVTCIFIIFPVLFSFSENNSTSNLSNMNSVTVVHQLKQRDEAVLAKRNLWFWKSRDEDRDRNSRFRTKNDDLLIVPYNKMRISIFSDAIADLMDYCFTPVAKTKEWLELPGSVSLSYPAFTNRYGTTFVPPPRSDSNRAPNEFFFKAQDKYRGVTIPQTLISNGHVAVRQQAVELPRIISNQDKNVNIPNINLKSMFSDHWNDYFNFDFKASFGGLDPNTLTSKNVRRKVENYFDAQSRTRSLARKQLIQDLFEKDSVLRLTGCKYSYVPDPVIIYYDLATDLFGVVSESSNTFLTGGVASLCDYIDIFYFKWVGAFKTFSESMSLGLPEPNDLSQAQKSFSEEEQNIGLPQNYDPTKWWEQKQTELETFFLNEINKTSRWYMDELQTTKKNVRDETSIYEGFTLLQLEAEQFFTGLYRPDLSDPTEALLNTDARFRSFNPRFVNGQPTIVDVKVPIDPAVLIARNQSVRSLEKQINDIVENVRSQQERTKNDFNETVCHVINLIRIRPVHRAFFISSFKEKAKRTTIDLNRVIFLNISDTDIY